MLGGLGLIGSASLFGYQHVGISNAKPSHWGSRPTRDPNASCFALQWNIGFTVGLPMDNLKLEI